MISRTELIENIANNIVSDWRDHKALRAMVHYYKNCPVDEFIRWTRLPLREITEYKFYVV